MTVTQEASNTSLRGVPTPSDDTSQDGRSTGSGPIQPSLLKLLPTALMVALGIAVIGYSLGRFVAIGTSYVGD